MIFRDRRPQTPAARPTVSRPTAASAGVSKPTPTETVKSFKEKKQDPESFKQKDIKENPTLAAKSRETFF